LLKRDKYYDIRNYESYTEQYDKRTVFEYFLNFKMPSEKLTGLFNKRLNNTYLKTLLIQLSLTDLYDSDTRRRFNMLDIQDDSFDKFVAAVDSELTKDMVNDYTYKIPFSENAFDFVKRLPALKVLNTMMMGAYVKITKIDLSPLEQIEQIGDNFLSGPLEVTEIDLRILSNVKKIGKYFMSGCKTIKTIDLSPLKNVSYIGGNFMVGCSQLEKIDLSPLINMTEINVSFLEDCFKLSEVKFPPKIKVIDSFFLGHSKSLKTIDLSCFSNVTLIFNSFLSS